MACFISTVLVLCAYPDLVVHLIHPSNPIPYTYSTTGDPSKIKRFMSVLREETVFGSSPAKLTQWLLPDTEALEQDQHSIDRKRFFGLKHTEKVK